MGTNILTPEQVGKLKACNSPDEVLALAQSEGVELSEDQLEQVAAGSKWSDVINGEGHVVVCGNCYKDIEQPDRNVWPTVCPHCGCELTKYTDVFDDLDDIR